MRVLITGATGFAGRHLVSYLLSHSPKPEIFGTCRHRGTDTHPWLARNVQLIESDVNSFQSTEKVLEAILPDVICHFAAEVSVPRSLHNPATTFQTNVVGTVNVLEAAKKTCKGALILIPGSAETYGNVQASHLPIRESQPLSPRSPYGVSKAVQETLARYYIDTSGLKICMTRTFHYTGPGQPLGFVCSDFAMQIAAIKRSKRTGVMKVGNLTARRDFTDIRDVVRAYWGIIDKGKSGAPYNVCTGKSVSIRSVLDALVQASNCNVAIEIDQNKLRPAEIPELVGDNSMLRKDTSWKPQRELQTTLGDLLKFWTTKLGADQRAGAHQ
ncbi:MAG: GDP-mannose 4,6-dehydratase [Chloroflexi bacterium]|nr:GDP-mannose 4,6-dehydratase [Chloroflexota bacterium]